MTQDELKTLVATAALRHVPPDSIIGVGTGSTVNKFIDALAAIKGSLRGAVSSSLASTERLRKLGIPVLEADAVETLTVYIDGADEIDGQGYMIKGGGAALTREKIVAEMADLWFHGMVALAHFGLSSADVVAELARREGLSGIEEKALRKVRERESTEINDRGAGA